MTLPSRLLIRAACVAAALGFAPFTALATDGYFVQGFGAVNSALGGAATAGNADDLIGSLYKNPANAALFPDRTASIVFGDIFPKATTSSSVAAVGLNGSSSSTISGVPYGSLMAVWRGSVPGQAYFAGAVSEAGLNFHAASSTTNPVFFPQAGATGNPFGGLFGGFGDVRSSLYVVRFPLGMTGAVPGGWSWGVSLDPSWGRNLFSPAAFAAPTLGTNGHPLYSTVQHVDNELGFGAQAGLRYQVDDVLSAGLSVSTPTWFNTYSWGVTDPAGSRTITFKMNRPLTAQAGINRALGDTTHLLADLGYIAYGEADGFSKLGYTANGSIAGLGWKDSWTAELGLQQTISKELILRLGYNYCSDPIPASATFYNVGSPLHIAHHLSAGLSYSLQPGLTVDVSYTHGFAHTQSSSWYNPAGAVPGSNLTSAISGDEFAIGTTFRF